MNDQCKNCGTLLKGDYCHNCGEKVLTHRDKAMRNWLSEVFSNFIQLDGKFINSIKGLLFRPSEMAKNYAEGKRKPYLNAVNFFLIANLVYFLLPSFDIFKTNLYVQLNYQVYIIYV